MVDVYSVSDSIGLRTKIIIFLVLLILPALFTSAYIPPLSTYAENDCIVVDGVIGKMVFPLSETKVMPIKKSALGTTNRDFAADWPFGAQLGYIAHLNMVQCFCAQRLNPMSN